MTLPQGCWADPGHHHHQAGQVRLLVGGQAGQVGHVHALVAHQLGQVVAAHWLLWQQLLSETSLQLRKPE